MVRTFACLIAAIALHTCATLLVQAAEPESASWRHDELRRFPAAEAKQGVTADAEHIYVITNTAVGKYRKDSGERVGGWAAPKQGPITHLNAGLIHDGKLYCAHSNYPTIPATSSVEIIDPATMQHVGTHSLGIAPGSLTWIDFRDGRWYACFAHYSKDKPRTGRDPAWTELVEFDDQWRRTAGWVFPPSVVSVFGGSSCSGGAFGPGGLLFVTGHDAPKLFVLQVPKMGSVLEHVGTVDISAHGQAFDWDAAEPGLLYSISRESSEVIVSRVTKP